MTDSSPLETAQSKFAESLTFRSISSENVTIDNCLNRVAFDDVLAPIDSPPYARAIVEGFLVNTRDTAAASEDNKLTFSSNGEIKPGDNELATPGKNEGVQVSTGSMIPEGSFSIVRMWEAEVDGNSFSISRSFAPDFFIETQGCDIEKNSVIIAAGTLITAANIGSLASLGINELSVCKKPIVSIFASGDEVIPHTSTFKPGSIFDCNSPMLAAAVSDAGGIAKLCGIQTDNFDAFVSAVKKALTDSDMILIAGGTAINGRDFISDLLMEVGKLIIDGVPMRSGRPLIMGVTGNIPIICVAGHPPEALRGFNLFGQLALNYVQGSSKDLPADSNDK